MDYVLSQAHHGYQHNEGGHKADAVNVSTFLCSHIFCHLFYMRHYMAYIVI